MKNLRKLAVVALAAASLFVTGCKKQAEPFFFVQMSDPQMGFKEKGSIERSVDLLNETVATVNRLHPAFVVVTGDMLTHWNSEAELNAYKAGISGIDADIPVYEIPGNHDFRTVKEPESGPAFFEHWDSDRFEFWHGGSYFLGFNSCYVKDDLADQEKEQYKWMVKCLRQNAKKADHVVLFTHCSIIREAADEEEDYFNFQAPYREKYLKLCKKYGVDMVLSGHYHRHRSVEYEGTTFVTCTASGWPLGDGFSGINVVGIWPDHYTWSVTPCEDAVNPLR